MTETKSEAEVLLIINNKINELFENQIEFSSDLVSKLLVSFKKSKLDVQKICNYIQWAYKYLNERCKNKNVFLVIFVLYHLPKTDGHTPFVFQTFPQLV